MKRLLPLIVPLLIILQNAYAKDRYWIGNGGTRGDGSHWSNTSGGSPCNCIPLLSDNVFFDANSFGGGGQTVSVDQEAYCKSMNWAGAAGSSMQSASVNVNTYIRSINLSKGAAVNVKPGVLFGLKGN
jgi:hypothetical protein